jgi:RNA polymerase sigma-70 factor (ECF subfamily)
MAENNAFEDLICRVRAGDQAAAEELVRLYEPAIRRAVRVWSVDPRLRRLFDSMDICQSVFGSFFVRAALGQYDLDRPEKVLRLLINMSRKKLADHARQEGAARRDYRRSQAGSRHEQHLVAAGASPSEQVEAEELLREFRKRLSPGERQLAEQRALGQDWNQIAAAQGSNPEALRKKLTRAVERIAKELQLDGFDHV